MNLTVRNDDLLSGLLVDTWWYALTSRLSAAEFASLAKLRVKQGFSAVQLVVGIPPEVGPENENAASDVGPAWNLNGEFNADYLQLAWQRINQLNDLGLRVIVFGAWGHQINWLGRDRMAGWWAELISRLDDLDVIYCLTGESNLWIGKEDILLPDRTTSAVKGPQPPEWLPGKVRLLGYKIIRAVQSRQKIDPRLRQKRKADWSYVLEYCHQRTERPLIIHSNFLETGFQAVDNPQLLAANSTQTGHSEASRKQIWQMPIAHQAAYPDVPFINLEPWYEGITGHFHTGDQIFAYWVSMLAGAASFCYGAHGIWNVGDGRFLGQWGSQSFDQAKALATPELIGRSHQLFLSFPPLAEVSLEVDGDHLLTISRRQEWRHITFIPEIRKMGTKPEGKIWLPLAGKESAKLPGEGPVLIFRV